MSFITLIIIQKTRIAVIQKHYRFVIEFFNTEFSDIDVYTQDRTYDPWLDAGYIIIDFNNRVIVNSQIAFTFSDLEEKIEKKLQKKWEVISLL